MKAKIIYIIVTILLLLTGLSATAGAAEGLPFADVPQKSWYTAYVSDVYAAGIMKGKSESEFDPAGTVSRAEFVTAMARLSGETLDGYEENVKAFPDASSDKWYAKYLGWGVAVGLVKGQGDGRLAPDAPVTRAEMVTLMARLMDYMDTVIPGDIHAERSFSDVEKDRYYSDALDTMRRTMLINGDGTGKFNPGDTAQRHSMAAIISRFLEAEADAETRERGLALITIVTETGRDVESKEDYIRAEFTLKGEDGRDISDGSIRIRGRGNATWKMEKKSYKMKFDEKVCLMKDGDTKAKEWTLLANHCDKSLIRNHVAQSLGRTLDGIEWAPYTELVAVYLNGEYRGVYMLCEQVEVGKNRVDINDGEADDIGFLIELDGYAEGEYNKDFFTVNGVKYTVKSDFKDEEQVIALKLHLEMIQNIVKEGDKDKVLASLDMDSVLDMYLVQELMRNLDAGWSSFYMYFYEPHGKLYFGPPWDFDLSTGNTYNSSDKTGLFVGHKTYNNGDYNGTTNEWFAALLRHQWFREMVRDRFNEKKDEILETVNECCKHAYMNMEYLDRNFEAWDVMNELINQEPIPVLRLKSCTENVEYLGQWFYDRHMWIDEYYNSDKFIKEYNVPDMEYGKTELLDADVWTIPDWFEGDKLVQIYMDILFSSVETQDGRIFARMGLTATLTPDNVAKVLLEDQLGAEKGRYTIVFDEGEFAAMKQTFSGLGMGQGIIAEMHYTIKDKVTGEESLPAFTPFVFIKQYADWTS